MSYIEHFEQIRKNWAVDAFGTDVSHDFRNGAQLKDTIFTENDFSLAERYTSIGGKRERTDHLILPFERDLLKIDVTSGIIAVNDDKKDLVIQHTDADLEHVAPRLATEGLYIAYNVLKWRQIDEDQNQTMNTVAYNSAFTRGYLEDCDAEIDSYNNQPKRGVGIDKLAKPSMLPSNVLETTKLVQALHISRVSASSAEIQLYVGSVFKPLGDAAINGYMRPAEFGAHVDWVTGESPWATT